MGESGYDMEAWWQPVGKLEVPEGLGVLEQFEWTRKYVTDRPIKVTVPGPLSYTIFIAPGGPYKSPLEIALDFVPAVNAELKRLVAAGAEYIQLDEPLSPHLNSLSREEGARYFVDLVNRTVDGVKPKKLAVHICFGTYKRQPFNRRSYRRLFPELLEARCDQIVLEFANREMAEIELWKEYAVPHELGAGVIDIRSYYVETPEDVAAMLRKCL